MSAEADGPLSRWSRLKREARARRAPIEEVAEAAPLPVDTPAETDRDDADLDTLSDAELAARFALPDPSALAHGDDFRAFLKAGVPRRLRNIALGRLWSVMPGDAALDGLIDYAEDFTDAAVGVENLATSYQVGKGMRAHTEELTRQEAARAEGRDPFAPEPTDAGETEAGEAEAAETDDAEAEAESLAQADTDALEADAPGDAAKAEAAQAEAPADVTWADPLPAGGAPRRRARFTFDE